MKCIFLYFVMTSAALILTDLRLMRRANLTEYVSIQLNQSHSGWPPIQPPFMWANFSLPCCKQTIQITLYDQHNRITSKSALSSRVAYVNSNSFGIEYWADPFTFYILAL